MINPRSWANAFLNSLKDCQIEESFIKESLIEESLIDDCIETLKALASSISSLGRDVFGSSAAAKLESLIREGVKQLESPISSEKALQPLVVRFLILMVKKNTFRHFNLIMNEIEKILDKRRHIMRASIEYCSSGENSFPIGEDFEMKLKEAIKIRMGAEKVILTKRQNPDLIGGYRLRIGDEVIDASIKSELRKLETYFLTSHGGF